MPDSCYLCELGKEGLFIPADWVPGGRILVCSRCVLEVLFTHPKLAGFKGATVAAFA